MRTFGLFLVRCLAEQRVAGVRFSARLGRGIEVAKAVSALNESRD